MKRLPLILLAITAISSCDKKADSADPHGAPAEKSGGPPALPPYQMRAVMPTGDRLTAGRDGEALFSNLCGSCHLAGGMGTNLLTKQMIMATRPPSDGLLANRKDPTPDYVKSVVRQGKVAMPRLSRAEVTDAELDAIATYLGKAAQ